MKIRHYNDGDVLEDRDYPKVFSFDCGCEVELENRKKSSWNITNFCEEHDPTIFHDGNDCYDFDNEEPE